MDFTELSLFDPRKFLVKIFTGSYQVVNPLSRLGMGFISLESLRIDKCAVPVTTQNNHQYSVSIFPNTMQDIISFVISSYRQWKL